VQFSVQKKKEVAQFSLDPSSLAQITEEIQSVGNSFAPQITLQHKNVRTHACLGFLARQAPSIKLELLGRLLYEAKGQDLFIYILGIRETT
jgi:hypothetical protein